MVGEWRLAYQDEQPNPMLDDGVPLVLLIADSPVVGNGDPSLAADSLEPLLVAAIGLEVVAMSLNV